jgi:hypothetical protein
VVQCFAVPFEDNPNDSTVWSASGQEQQMSGDFFSGKFTIPIPAIFSESSANWSNFYLVWRLRCIDSVRNGLLPGDFRNSPKCALWNILHNIALKNDVTESFRRIK